MVHPKQVDMSYPAIYHSPSQMLIPAVDITHPNNKKSSVCVCVWMAHKYINIKCFVRSIAPLLKIRNVYAYTIIHTYTVFSGWIPRRQPGTRPGTTSECAIIMAVLALWLTGGTKRFEIKYIAYCPCGITSIHFTPKLAGKFRKLSIQALFVRPWSV